MKKNITNFYKFIFIYIVLFLFSCAENENENENITETTITITSPDNESTIQDSILIQCESNDDNLVLKIELWLDDDSTGICDYTAPFEIYLNTLNYSNGIHELFVRLYDENGNIYDSETLTLNFDNFLMYSKTIGTSDLDDSGYSILQTQDSSFIILGSSDNDILLLKTNRYGAIQWQQQYGGSQIDRAYHFQQTSDNGFIISGSTESYGSGGSDIWLIKTDANGLIEWNICFGSAGNENGHQVRELNDGGFILVGSKDFFGDGNNDIWMIKTNSLGDSLWTRKFGGAQFEEGIDLLVNNDGGFLILGNTESYGNGGQDIWIIKTDSDGNEDWNNIYGNGSNDRAQSIIKTYDDGYMIRYIVQSFGEGNTAIGLLRISSSGEQIWTKTIGGSNGIPGNNFQSISDDEYIMVCSLFDNGENAYNVYLTKINDSGDIIWDKIYGENENDYGMSVLKTKDSGYAIIGSTNNFGNGNKNFSDLWLIKTNQEGRSIQFND